MSVRQTKHITPTFQMVLNKQIGDAMDAMNEGNWERAYAVLLTLMGALKPEHKKPLKKNEVKRIETALERASKPNSSSFYRGLIESSTDQEAVLVRNIRVLYEKIMETLHKHDYLEIYVRPRFEKKKKLSVDRIET